MCQEHLQMRKNSNTKLPDIKKNDYGTNHVGSMEAVEGTKANGADGGKKSKATLENYPTNGDNVKSKKKNISANDVSSHVNGETHLKDNGPIEDTSSVPSELVKKSKDKKKKHKNESEALDKDLHEKQDNSSVPSESVKKSKDKKKKHKNESESSDKNLQEKKAEVAAGETSEKADGVSQEEKSGSKTTKEEISIQKVEACKEKKGSKKRKKSASNDTGHVEETPFDDSKRRKTDNLDLSNGTEEATKTPKGSDNGVLENDGGKKSEKQNKTKERNGSVEPKTANAFQRVKQDEVEFADERLQDNSYWAKDGADSGYGAKAQEVLGQVRGRDFRHEKTKKKRGTYRGGQIDLQSHSVKFNYDDDDE